MAVYKSKRKEAAAEFIKAAKELRKTTIRIGRKFPTSYRYPITNRMMELAGEVYTNCLKANGIYMHKEMDEHDYELRHRFLMLAGSSAEALCGEIAFCAELVSEGENFLGSRAERDRAFQTWAAAGNAAKGKIKGVIESDKKRWNSYGEKKGEEKEMPVEMM